MKRASMAVIALLFASHAQAVDLLRHKYGDDDGEKIPAVKPPPDNNMGDAAFEHTMSAGEGVPYDRSKSMAPTFGQRKKKVDPISPEGYDPWVYKFSKENMGTYPLWHLPDSDDWNTRAQMKLQKKKKVDPISPENYDPWVYKFSKDNMGTHPMWHLEDSDDQNTRAQMKHHRKHQKRPDVAERGMDEDVHGFVKESLPPLESQEKDPHPFIPNGSDSQAFKGAFNQRKHHHHRKHKNHHSKHQTLAQDLTDDRYANKHLPPLSEQINSEYAPAPNGAGIQHLAQDITDDRYAEKVLPPLSEQINSKEPFLPNGSANVYAQKRSQAQDITDDRYAEKVLPPLSEQINSKEPFLPNGSANVYAQKQAHENDDYWQDYTYPFETGMNLDHYPYHDSAISAHSDRPSRLGMAPEYNGYKNKY